MCMYSVGILPLSNYHIAVHCHLMLFRYNPLSLIHQAPLVHSNKKYTSYCTSTAAMIEFWVCRAYYRAAAALYMT